MTDAKIVMRISIPNIEAVSNDAQMAAKYFLDIMNDGTPEMIDGVSEILKAIWIRLALKDRLYDPERVSDEDLAAAINSWYRRMHKIEFQPEEDRCLMSSRSARSRSRPRTAASTRSGRRRT